MARPAAPQRAPRYGRCGRSPLRHTMIDALGEPGTFPIPAAGAPCGVLGAIGNTPLVPLDRVFAGAGFRLFGKLEMLNPGGSIKDRAAVRMLTEGLEQGTLGHHTSVLECSSGTLGYGLGA